MGEKIIDTEEKRKKLQEMKDSDKYTSGDMVDLIMREKAPSELIIPMENVEANKVPESAQHEQLHQIREIQKAAKSKQTETQGTLKTGTIHVDDNSHLQKTDDNSHSQDELEL